MSTHQDKDVPRRHPQILPELTQAMVFLFALITSPELVDTTWAVETNSELVFGMSTA